MCQHHCEIGQTRLTAESGSHARRSRFLLTPDPTRIHHPMIDCVALHTLQF